MGSLAHLTPAERMALDVFVQRLYSLYGDRVQSAMLFGSKSRGDAGPDSDIDVLVVLTEDDSHLCSDIRRLAARVSLEHNLLLSLWAVGRSQWERLSRYRFPLYLAVQADGVDLAASAA